MKVTELMAQRRDLTKYPLFRIALPDGSTTVCCVADFSPKRIEETLQKCPMIMECEVVEEQLRDNA